MIDTPLTHVKIEARALPAPGYMGLPQAKHIFLTSADHSFGWPCFGRGYTSSDPGSLVYTALIYKEWALALAQPDSDDQYLAGVANTINGTCHTMANRILALSDDDNANVSNSIDDPYSVLVFGKYGFGTGQLCEILTKSFEKTTQTYAASSTLLDTVLERVRNPFKDELKAWEIVIREQMKIDISELLNSSPNLADAALSVITSYCEARNAMYELCFDYTKGQAPTQEQAAKIRMMLKDLALDYVQNVLNALTVSNYIFPQQRDAFESAIKAYIDKLGS